jgi:hypothetical protein
MNEMSLVAKRLHLDSIHARFDSVGEKTEEIHALRATCGQEEILVPWGIGHWLSQIDRTYRAQTLSGLTKANPRIGMTFDLADLFAKETTSNE